MYVDGPLFLFVFQAQDRIGKLQDIYCKYLLSYDLLPKVTSLFVCTTSTAERLPYLQELLLADVARVCLFVLSGGKRSVVARSSVGERKQFYMWYVCDWNLT